MKLICKRCEKVPFIKLCYLEEGKLIVRINCKCGKLFHDISTFVSEYTDIETQLEAEKEEAEVNGKTGKYKKITYRVKMSSFIGSVCEGFLADKEAISLISETFSSEEDQVKEIVSGTEATA